MKLLCFGDLHLGQGSQYPGRLDAQQHVLEQIATLAFNRRVDGILFAGDAFEGPGVPPEQLQLFAQFVKACRTVEIPILAITGNGKHDAAVRDTNGLAIFQHIDGITVASTPDVYPFAGCSVAVLPWVHPGRLIARAGRDVSRDEINQVAGDLLVDVARDLRDDCDGGGSPLCPTILLGHWSVSGTALPAGLPVDELREPVLSAAALDELGFDHVVMGHIHRPQTIGERGFYTGSPLPLNFGEEHEGHGVAILHVGEREEIDFPGAEYVEIDSPRFVTLDYDWTTALDERDPVLQLEKVSDDAIVRVRYTATAAQARRVDVGRIRAQLLEAGARVVKVEPTIVREQRARVQGVDEGLDEQAALELYIDAQHIDGELADLMRATTRDLLEAVA